MAQPITGRDSAPHAISNRSISIFAEEQNMRRTARKQAAQTAAAAEAAAVVEEEQPVEAVVEQPVVVVTVKRCIHHVKYLDRLLDVAKAMVDGQTDVSMRLLPEFGKSSSAKDGLQSFCKACDHIAMHDARVKASGGTAGARERVEVLIARRVEKRDKLTAEIDALRKSLTETAKED